MPYLTQTFRNDYFNKLYNSLFVSRVQKVIPFVTNLGAFNIFRALLSADYTMLLDYNVLANVTYNCLIYNRWLNNDYDDNKCKHCTFTHLSYDKTHFKEIYPLLIDQNIEDIITKCKITANKISQTK